MAEHTYRIVGHVHDRQTHQGLAELRVEAWDKDRLSNDLIGSAVTDTTGVFHIAFTTSHFRELFLDRHPDLFFRVFQQDTLLASTEDTVLWNVTAPETAVVIEVDVSTALALEPNAAPGQALTSAQTALPPVPNALPRSTSALPFAPIAPSRPAPAPTAVVTSPASPFVVRGQVRQVDGNMLVGGTVHAFDKDLRGEELLGQATTDPAGHYAIQYTATQFQRAEKQRADVIFRLFDAAGQPLTNFTAADEAGKPLRMLPVRNGSDNPTTIPIVFQAQPEETVNFVVVPVPVSLPSEYEQLLAVLEPLLVNVVIVGNRQPTLIDQLADLTTEEIDFLTGETDIPRQQLAFLITAATLQQQAAAQHFVVPAAAFYGLAREGLPLDLAALGLKSQRARSDALDKALTDNIIPATLRAALTRILDQLHQFVVGHVLTTPPAPGRSSLGALLGTFIPASAQQATFLTAYANYDGPRDKFWTEELPKQPGFQDPREIKKVQLALQLGMLTQNHVPLIQAVQRTRPLTAVRDLVQLDAAAWTALVTQPAVGVPPDVPGRTPQEQVTNYVTTIVETLKAALPTAYVGLGLASAPAVALRLTKQVLASHPGLDPGKPLPDDFD
jgi:hypothetical protein